PPRAPGRRHRSTTNTTKTRAQRTLASPCLLAEGENADSPRRPGLVRARPEGEDDLLAIPREFLDVALPTWDLSGVSPRRRSPARRSSRSFVPPRPGNPIQRRSWSRPATTRGPAPGLG